MKKMHITLTGESAEIMDRLCAVTGLTPPSIIALLLRKSGRELESWVNSPVTSTTSPPLTNSSLPTPSSNHPATLPLTGNSEPSQATSNYPVEPTLPLPPDSGDDWTPIEL